MPSDEFAALLVRPPSGFAWAALLYYLRARGPGITVDQLEAVRATLRGWPPWSHDATIQAEDPEGSLDEPEAQAACDFSVIEGSALAGVEALARRAPERVRALRFNACFDVAAAIGILDALPALEALDLSGEGCDETDVVAALRRARLGRLRALVLPAGASAPATLADAAFWPSLRRLSLAGSGLDGAALRALFGHERSPALEGLWFEPCSPPDALASFPSFNALRELSGVVLGPALLAWLPSLRQLERLAAVYDPAGLGALSAARLEALRSLRIWGRVDDEGAAALTEAFPSLEELSAHHCGVGPGGAAALGRGLRGLRALALSLNPLGDEGARALAPALDGVRSLELRSAGFGAQGLRALTPCLAEVETLRLNGNRLGPAGARRLAETPMPHLKILGLAGCDIGVAGARALAASPNLAGLDILELNINYEDRPLVPKGVGALARSEYASDAVREMLKAWAGPARRPQGFWGRLFGSA